MPPQVKLLIAIRAIRMFFLIMPVTYVYWGQHGLSIDDVFLLQAIFGAAVVLLEAPTGRFADRFGHRYSVILSCYIASLGFFCYWMFPGYPGFIAAELFLALSAGLMSGAKDALLFETLESVGKRELFTRYHGQIFAAANVAEATAALTTTGILFLAPLETVFLLQWLVALSGIPLAHQLRETRIHHATDHRSLLVILRSSLYGNTRLRALHLYSATLFASTLTLVWFLQPTWQSWQIPVVYFGVLWAGSNLISAIAASQAARLQARLRFRTLFGCLSLVPLVGFSLLATGGGVWLFPVLLLFVIARGVGLPLIQSYIQRECRAEERATEASINALSFRAVATLFFLLIGPIAEQSGLDIAFLVCALTLGTSTLIAYVVFYQSRQ